VGCVGGMPEEMYVEGRYAAALVWCVRAQRGVRVRACVCSKGVVVCSMVCPSTPRGWNSKWEKTDWKVVAEAARMESVRRMGAVGGRR